MSGENIIPNSQDWNDFFYDNHCVCLLESTTAVHNAAVFYCDLGGGGRGWEPHLARTLREDSRERGPPWENTSAFTPLNGGSWKDRMPRGWPPKPVRRDMTVMSNARYNVAPMGGVIGRFRETG